MHISQHKITINHIIAKIYCRANQIYREKIQKKLKIYIYVIDKQRMYIYNIN